ncbi:hypothetical protein W02_31680 [Nitrospira sp. KM1]|uniref:chemotaxis protein CheB n=1 Tax=Nitrospira sp. KM1 TaxID=1936990 RepID=UPI0013A7A796|nr:chemotaxis protein CheB [Nitrospira sp. KM1]BCA56028.1 hypothetical protein W02_31680 [Nitrospira sp. KM1]
MKVVTAIRRNVIVIGASSGGVQALQYLCRMLPRSFPAVVGVVIHRSPFYVSNIEAIYGKRDRIRVREAKMGDVLEEGTAYFAPSDHHMQFQLDGVRLTRGPKMSFTRPAADALFLSAAASFGERVAGVILTGGGSDGAHGLIAIKEHGGKSIVQDPEEAIDPSMPVNGILEDSVDYVVSLADLPPLLLDLAMGRAAEGTLARHTE